MSWFQLDPSSVADRFIAEGTPAKVPSLAASLWRGVVGFTIVSIAGFAPWIILGRWFGQHIGEVGLYAVCAFVFIGLSGPLMHRLVIGPGSLPRFYKLFGIAFSAYSLAWIVGWMLLRGHAGSLAGLLSGTVVMGGLLAVAFGVDGVTTAKVIAVLFVLNSIGYFAGGWVEGCLMPMKECSIIGIPLARPAQVMLAKLQWGVCYGIGLGAGLGAAFHLCQAPVRAFLAANPHLTKTAPQGRGK